MIYLLLAVLSSACVSIFMRLSKNHIKNNMAMFTANYFLCAVMSFLFMEEKRTGGTDGLTFAVLLGLFSGILFLLSFVLLEKSIKINGVTISATFMKLGVLIPTMMAIVVFGEKPGIYQIAGIALSILAIFVINSEKGEKEKAGSVALLLILLLGSGLTDSTINVYDKVGASALKDHYLLFTFLSACFISFAFWIKEKQKVTLKDVLFGFLIGIPNYFSSRFLLLALHSVDAVIIYPAYSVLTILAISAAGYLIFKENLEKRKLYGIGIILLALVMLNI